MVQRRNTLDILRRIHKKQVKDTARALRLHNMEQLLQCLHVEEAVGNTGSSKNPVFMIWGNVSGAILLRLGVTLPGTDATGWANDNHR